MTAFYLRRNTILITDTDIIFNVLKIYMEMRSHCLLSYLFTRCAHMHVWMDVCACGVDVCACGDKFTNNL